MAKNKHGLSRDIPEKIKREIRKRCNYGCVVCADALIEYHHMKPEFYEAQAHEPDKITLLCNACHGKATSRIFSPSFIEEHNQKPKAFEKGYAFACIQSSDRQALLLGNNILSGNNKAYLSYNDQPMIWLNKAKDDENILVLNANFYSHNGLLIVKIRENEITINTKKVKQDDLDVSWKKSTIRIKQNVSKGFNLEIDLQGNSPLMVSGQLYYGDYLIRLDKQDGHMCIINKKTGIEKIRMSACQLPGMLLKGNPLTVTNL